jgi:hypothetical protein
MQLEKQICSLQLAGKLKELGVKQDSRFWWMKPDPKYRDKYDLHNLESEFDQSTPDVMMFWFLGEAKEIGLGWCLQYYSAFTVAELGDMLPKTHGTYKSTEGRWTNCNIKDGQLTNVWALGGDTEADARAKMLIYLLENNLMASPAE